MLDIIDILGRDETIDKLMNFINLLSENSKNCCFAIDGKWGSGKTYIIQRLEDKLRIQQNETSNDDRYYVFHYNCWEYDFYDEPAIAIISAMLDNMEKDKMRLGKDVNNAIDDVKNILLEITNEYSKNKFGIGLVEVLRDSDEKHKNAEKSKKEFDDYQSFKEALDKVHVKMREIAENKTVFIAVDELDRCVPEYAIKVLERLHHIFFDVDNLVVLLAVDGTQLEHSVKSIYGQETDTDRFLKKFISFRFPIDNGNINNYVFDQYSFYFNKFEKDNNVYEMFNKLITTMNIEVRNVSKIINKLDIIHDLTCNNEKSAVLLAFELMWGIIKYRTKEELINGKHYDRYGDDLYWIEEIILADNKSREECLGTESYNYLKQLREDSKLDNVKITNEIVGTRWVKNNSIGKMYYIFNNLYGRDNKTRVYQETISNELINTCSNFDLIGKMII